MIDNVRKNFAEGVARVRWYASLLGERLRVEVAVIKLMREAADLEARRDSLARDMGLRVFELRERPEIGVYEDRAIREAISEIESIHKRVSELRARTALVSEARQ